MNTSQASTNLIFKYQIDKLIAAYILPPAITINFLSNIMVIVVFWRISKIRQILPSTIFLNYLSMAINDIANSFPTHITHFLGNPSFVLLIYHLLKIVL